MRELIKKRRGAATAVGTIGIAGSVAFVLLSLPGDLGLFVVPEKYTVHATAIIVWAINRTMGKWLD